MTASTSARETLQTLKSSLRIQVRRGRSVHQHRVRSQAEPDPVNTYVSSKRVDV